MALFGRSLAAILGLSAMLAFGGAAEAKTTLNALFMAQAGYSESDVRAMTDAYLKDHPDVAVKLEFVPYEQLHDKITLAAGSGEGYDVVLYDVIWPAEFAENKILTDVTDRIDAKTKAEVEDGAWTTVYYKDKAYGMPWSVDSKYLFYNKEMLQKAGIAQPPKTWDELIADAKIIKQRGIVDYPIVWSWSQAEAVICDYAILLQAYGGKFLDDSGKPAFNKGGGLDALKFMANSIKDGVTNPHSTEYLEEDVRGVFSSGKAAFALNWTYMYGMANTNPKESQVVGKVGVVAPPGIAGKNPIGTVNGAMGLGIPESSKSKDAAWDYIKFLSSPAIEAKYAASSPPIWKSFYEEAAKQDRPDKDLMAAEAASFEALSNRPQVPEYQQFSARLQQAIQQALLGKATPEDALNAAASELSN